MCTKRGGTKEHTVLCLLYLSGGLTSSAAAILAGVSISCDSNRPLQKKNNSPGIIYINLILYTTTNMTLESTDVHKLVCVYQILNRMYSELQIEEEAWNFYKRAICISGDSAIKSPRLTCKWPITSSVRPWKMKSTRHAIRHFTDFWVA